MPEGTSRVAQCRKEVHCEELPCSRNFTGSHRCTGGHIESTRDHECKCGFRWKVK
jgi:hypothetical protein